MDERVSRESPAATSKAADTTQLSHQLSARPSGTTALPRASRQQRQELAQRFLTAAQQGDLRALEALLAQDVALHADGGGKVPALARPVNGRERVARTLSAGMSVLARFGVRIHLTVRTNAVTPDSPEAAG